VLQALVQPAINVPTFISEGQQLFMGRPPGRIQDRIFRMRVSDKFLRSIDNWRRRQEDRPSCAEAIRRLVEQALTLSSDDKLASKQKAQKGSELAGRSVERVVNKSMPPEEKERRKRVLIKGPKEFRDIREDLPKRKE
jgi:hypothetical protein